MSKKLTIEKARKIVNNSKIKSYIEAEERFAVGYLQGHADGYLKGFNEAKENVLKSYGDKREQYGIYKAIFALKRARCFNAAKVVSSMLKRQK